VLLDGEATVAVKGSQVATLEAGAVIGELGLVGHKLRSATVTSTTSLDLLHLQANDFREILKRRPKLKEIFLARTAPAAEATSQA
jgi:CRP-like cAMP-binding protein